MRDRRRVRYVSSGGCVPHEIGAFIHEKMASQRKSVREKREAECSGVVWRRLRSHSKICKNFLTHPLTRGFLLHSIQMLQVCQGAYP